MNKMKKILENWQRAVTKRAKQPITPEQIEHTMNQVIKDASIALDQMDSLPSSLFDEVGEEGSSEKRLSRHTVMPTVPSTNCVKPSMILLSPQGRIENETPT